MTGMQMQCFNWSNASGLRCLLNASHTGDHDYGHSEPYAVIQRDGRFTYRVVVRDGDNFWGPTMMDTLLGWRVWGRARAERKAKWALAQYKQQQQPPETWEVR